MAQGGKSSLKLQEDLQKKRSDAKFMDENGKYGMLVSNCKTTLFSHRQNRHTKMQTTLLKDINKQILKSRPVS
jgi:hypothetical protein